MYKTTSKKIKFNIGKSFLGPTLVATTSGGICFVGFDDDSFKLEKEFLHLYPKAEFNLEKKIFNDVKKFIENPAEVTFFDLDDSFGTPFQRQVWNGMQGISFGETISYEELAKRIGKPRHVRAVANACGANQIAVLVPCHRVIRADGSLGGYRWGVKRKFSLIEREKDWHENKHVIS